MKQECLTSLYSKTHNDLFEYTNIKINDKV